MRPDVRNASVDHPIHWGKDYPRSEPSQTSKVLLKRKEIKKLWGPVAPHRGPCRQLSSQIHPNPAKASGRRCGSRTISSSDSTLGSDERPAQCKAVSKRFRMKIATFYAPAASPLNTASTSSDLQALAFMESSFYQWEVSTAIRQQNYGCYDGFIPP